MNKLIALAASLLASAVLAGCGVGTDAARSEVPQPGTEITQAPSQPPAPQPSLKPCPRAHCPV